MSTDTTLYCTFHPTTETLLRCNKCGRPICTKCAVQTPVGFRCKECIRSQQAVYFNIESKDYPIAMGVGFLASLIATPIVGFFTSLVPFFFGLLIAFMGGSAAGGILSQIIRWAVSKRRGRYLALFALGGVTLGILVGGLLSYQFLGLHSLFNFVFVLFVGSTIVAAYQVLR